MTRIGDEREAGRLSPEQHDDSCSFHIDCLAMMIGQNEDAAHRTAIADCAIQQLTTGQRMLDFSFGVV